jgi:aminoglycoside/choline kinase family phosphotransferase
MPSGPEQLTTEWLSEALGANVTSFDCEQIGIGVGLLGRLFRITMAIEGSGAKTAVAKFATLDEGARMNVAEPLNFYEKEVRFYQQAAQEIPVATPQVYVAEHDPATRDFVLLLEDLGDRRMEDQIAGCSIEDARTAVDALVALHSAKWESDFPAWLPSYSDPPFPQVIQGMYKQAWPQALEIVAGHLSPQMREFGERYVEIVDWFMAELGHKPWTMCHGDFRLDNLFFGSTPDHAPVTIVDWQIAFRGRAGYDVAYFVSQSLPTDVRRSHEQSLKDRYLEGLAKNGIDYPSEEFEKDYARTIAYCFIYPVVSAGQIEMTNERMRELILGILDRSVQAIVDNDALAILI